MQQGGRIRAASVSALFHVEHREAARGRGCTKTRFGEADILSCNKSYKRTAGHYYLTGSTFHPAAMPPKGRVNIVYQLTGSVKTAKSLSYYSFQHSLAPF